MHTNFRHLGLFVPRGFNCQDKTKRLCHISRLCFCYVSTFDVFVVERELFLCNMCFFKVFKILVLVKSL